MTEEQKVTPSPGAASLTEIDNLLNELDPEFNTMLTKITSEVGQFSEITGLESIAISADYLKEGADAGDAKDSETSSPIVAPVDDRKPEEITQGESFLEILGELSFASLLLPVHVLAKVFDLVLTLRKDPPLVVLKTVPEVMAPTFHQWFVLVQALVQKLKTYSLATYIKFAVIVILVICIRITLVDMKTRFAPDKSKDPFLKNWAEVADVAYTLQPEDLTENIDDPLKHPEYTVLIHKIAANLRAPNSHRTPMITTELYVEASNQDAAIEIKDRELEVRDTLERVFEQTTFDELDTKAGKERLKVHIRGALDQMLNKGHIKRVFFSALNMVP
jgi:flagellar basal body-associated protein FliL